LVGRSKIIREEDKGVKFQSKYTIEHPVAAMVEAEKRLTLAGLPILAFSSTSLALTKTL
jgi:hypothetical protein